MSLRARLPRRIFIIFDLNTNCNILRYIFNHLWESLWNWLLNRVIWSPIVNIACRHETSARNQEIGIGKGGLAKNGKAALVVLDLSIPSWWGHWELVPLFLSTPSHVSIFGKLNRSRVRQVHGQPKPRKLKGICGFACMDLHVRRAALTFASPSSHWHSNYKSQRKPWKSMPKRTDFHSLHKNVISKWSKRKLRSKRPQKKFAK